MNQTSPRVTASATIHTIEGPPKYGGGIVICNSRAQRHELAIALGMEILAIPGAVHLTDEMSGDGHVVSVDVEVLRSFPENTRRIDRSEPGPAPAPSMPSIPELRAGKKIEQRAATRLAAGRICHEIKSESAALAEDGNFEGANALLYNALTLMFDANYEEGEL